MGFLCNIGRGGDPIAEVPAFVGEVQHGAGCRREWWRGYEQRVSEVADMHWPRRLACGMDFLTLASVLPGFVLRK